MKLNPSKEAPFDTVLPIYNWMYPLSGAPSQRFVGRQALDVLSKIKPPRARAIYVHIPFCETICSFCPFVRGRYRDASEIDQYVSALTREIELKSTLMAATRVPIHAVFFGGGTPSLLEPRHILKIGELLRERFDMSEVREFSYEVEVKSVTLDRIEAMRAIGVTHARFGLQTFSSKYRELFDLSATIEQIISASRALQDAFPFASCDLLYGMNGQSSDEIAQDVTQVVELGLNNIDIYPINNVVTQRKLHRRFAERSELPASGLTKHYMSLLVRELMRDSSFLPHNGHGYVRVASDELSRGPVVTDRYSFVYHEHVYGCEGYDVLGFGTNAMSSFDGVTTFNTASRSEYISAIMDGWLPMEVKEHNRAVDACRPLALALPYHGSIERDAVDWDDVPDEVLQRLGAVVDRELVSENRTGYEITREGWEWYHCLMYYLLPMVEQRQVTSIVNRAMRDEKRHVEGSGLDLLRL